MHNDYIVKSRAKNAAAVQNAKVFIFYSFHLCNITAGISDKSSAQETDPVLLIRHLALFIMHKMNGYLSNSSKRHRLHSFLRAYYFIRLVIYERVIELTMYRCIVTKYLYVS